MTSNSSARRSSGGSLPEGERRPLVPFSMLALDFWRPMYTAAALSMHRVVQRAWDNFRSTVGFISSVLGFLGNSIVDASVKETRAQWVLALDKLKDYLDDSGIKDELRNGLNSRFIGNLTIMENIQNALYSDRRLHCVAPARHGVPPTQEAYTYMRYATAAYGSEMIASAWLATDETFRAPSMETVTNLLAHIGATKEDIVIMDVDYGEDLDCLRHFCVVDHSNKAVVLSIRGTFSMTGVMVDLVGFCDPFCGGDAHSGMATMAIAVWSKSGPIIMETLSKLKDYEFVITGHSLGAGVACLLNILVHHENIIPHTNNVRCFAFAPPPVFHPISAALEAVQHTFAYVHERDIVPFLSVNGILRFFSLMNAIDMSCRHLYFWEKASIDWNFSKPTPAMMEAARNSHDVELPATERAPILVIPAHAVVWLRKNQFKSFNQKVCDPHKLVHVGMLVNPDMITDHGPAKYEAAFKYLKEEQD